MHRSQMTQAYMNPFLYAVSQMNATIDDLAEAELCYAPQYGAAKDPINMAGMAAQNMMHQAVPVVRWSDIPAELCVCAGTAPKLFTLWVPQRWVCGCSTWALCWSGALARLC